MRTPIRHAVAGALLSFAGIAAAEGGLSIDPELTPWPRWQARVGLTGVSPLTRTDLAATPQLQGARLLGDWYFTGPAFGGRSASGGFRATSGVLLGSRAPNLAAPTLPSAGATLSMSQQSPRLGSSAFDADAANTTQPYLGVGYTGLSARGGWGFTADVGVLGSSGSGLRVGRVLSGSQSLDDALREMRLRPVVQLGVTYSF